jgi:hypothetical protein
MDQKEEGGAEKLIKRELERSWGILEAYLSDEVCDVVTPGIVVDDEEVRVQKGIKVSYDMVLQQKEAIEKSLLGALPDTPENRELAQKYIDLITACEEKFDATGPRT